MKKDWPEQWSKFVGAVTTANSKKTNRDTTNSNTTKTNYSASTKPTSKPKTRETTTTTKKQKNSSKLSKEQAKTLTHCYAYSSFLWIQFFFCRQRCVLKKKFRRRPKKKKILPPKKCHFFCRKKNWFAFCQIFLLLPSWFFCTENVLVFSDTTSSNNMLLSGIFA